MSAPRKTDVQMGNRYGALLVVDLRRKPRRSGAFEEQALCLCDCGKSSWIVSTRLRQGKRKECRGCTTVRAWKLIPRLPQHEIWLRKAEKNYRVDAALRGLEFPLDRAQFRLLLRGTCAYCGELPANGIDRKDNALGYTAENAVPCCATCNYGKRDMSVAEFLDWVKRVYKFRGWKK